MILNGLYYRIFTKSLALVYFNVFPLDRKAELKLLREIYIPEIVLRLHQVLFQTRDIIPG